MNAKSADNSPLTSSTENPSPRRITSKLAIRKIILEPKEGIVTDDSQVSAKKTDGANESKVVDDSEVTTKQYLDSTFVSLRAALAHNSGKTKRTNLHLPQSIPRERVIKTRAPLKPPSKKAQKSKASHKSPISKVTASDLAILRKSKPIIKRHPLLIPVSCRSGPAPCAKPSLWT